MTDLADLIAAEQRFACILADPPWSFKAWGNGRWKGDHSVFTPPKLPEYATMGVDEICALPVDRLAAKHCALFMWAIGCMLPESLRVIDAWGFKYKACVFNWVKVDGSQVDMFGHIETQWGLGFWTRQDSEFCLLATRGKPKRKSASVRQGIVERRREHSRKPDCVYDRIEQLVDGPRIELFARTRRPGWTAWGNEVDKFDPPYDAEDDFAKSIDVAYAAVRERVAKGGPTWTPLPSPDVDKRPESTP
jgi:N6-adenosine-specific RNA methylase IME4